MRLKILKRVSVSADRDATRHLIKKDIVLRIGIVLLNWNGIRNTIACLESIVNSVSGAISVIIIDNGSVEDAAGALTVWAEQCKEIISVKKRGAFIRKAVKYYHTELKDIVLISLHCNTGYGGGNNVGINYLLTTNVDYILILNNDMKLLPGTLEKMEAVLRSEKKAGVAGCKIIDIDKGHELKIGRIDYWLGVHFLKRIKKETKGIKETNFVPGCAMLVDRRVFEEIGGFNINYFLYADDIEFCHRARIAGWKLFINLDAQVLAKVSASSGGRRNPIYYYFVTRNTMYFISQHLNGVQKNVAAISFVVARILQIIQWTIVRKYQLIAATIRGGLDYRKRTHGIGYAKKYLDKIELNHKL